MKALHVVMLLIYAFLFVSSLITWIDTGYDAWGIATVGWFCALLFRAMYAIERGEL